MNTIVKEGRESDISVLGEDLLVEILCRLGSVKYATQCKYVCKRWCSLVNTTNSYLLHRWGQLNPKTESVSLITQYRAVIKHRKSNALSLNLKFLPCFSRKNPVHVLGSHKDLLLCCPNLNDHSRYYICNPLTKHWTALPPPPPLPTADARPTVEFMVDESGGRGSKFTVVRIFRYPPRVSVSIFSSDGGWREMDDGGGGGWREMFHTQKGRLIWLMRKEISGQVFRLYSWDLHSNYARLPRFPGCPTNGFESMSAIGGRLRMARVLGDHKNLFVWQFDDIKKNMAHAA